MLLSNFDGLNLRFCILFFISGISWLSLHAQKLYFSNIPRLNTKAYYNKVIGENDGGIYVLRFRDVDLKNGFTIERYSHNLDFTESENYILGKRERLIKVFTSDSGLCMLKMGKEKDKMVFTYLRTGFTVGNLKSGIEIYSSQNAEKIDDNVVVEYSPNRQYCALWLEETNAKGNQVFHCTIINTAGKIISQSTHETNLPNADVALEQVSVSDSGQSAMVYMLSRPDKRNTETSAEEHFIVGVDANGMHAAHSLGDFRFFISSYDLVYNQFTNKFLLVGFFDYKKPKSAHGILTLSFRPDDSLAEPKHANINRKFVSILIGAKEEESGEDPENYFIRKIVPRSDGGYLLVAEYFDITQQMETFYYNGVPQVSSKNIYNYNDILLISVNDHFEAEWEHQLVKRQSSYASLSYLNSLGVYVCEKNVNIIFNDNSSQNNRVMHVSLSRDGFVEQKILLNSDNEYNAIVPMEGKQTGHNRYVAPLIQSRQTSLIQIVEANP